jgi:hypothetical protein
MVRIGVSVRGYRVMTYPFIGYAVAVTHTYIHKPL